MEMFFYFLCPHPDDNQRKEHSREFGDEQQLQMENARLREGRLLLLQKALAPT
jgi:hypothetical protein